MKLTSLKGSECLPNMKIIDIYIPQTAQEKCVEKYGQQTGFNQAITKLEQVELCVDEEELAKSIYEEEFDIKWVDCPDYSKDLYRNIAKSLSQSKEKWLKLEVRK